LSKRGGNHLERRKHLLLRKNLHQARMPNRSLYFRSLLQAMTVQRMACTAVQIQTFQI
jgi:hypothetical protein